MIGMTEERMETRAITIGTRGSRLALEFDFQPGAAAALCFLRAAAERK